MNISGIVTAAPQPKPSCAWKVACMIGGVARTVIISPVKALVTVLALTASFSGGADARPLKSRIISSCNKDAFTSPDYSAVPCPSCEGDIHQDLSEATSTKGYIDPNTGRPAHIDRAMYRLVKFEERKNCEVVGYNLMLFIENPNTPESALRSLLDVLIDEMNDAKYEPHLARDWHYEVMQCLCSKLDIIQVPDFNMDKYFSDYNFAFQPKKKNN